MENCLVKPISLYLSIAENKPNYLWKTKNKKPNQTNNIKNNKTHTQKTSSKLWIQTKAEASSCWLQEVVTLMHAGYLPEQEVLQESSTKGATLKIFYLLCLCFPQSSQVKKEPGTILSKFLIMVTFSGGIKDCIYNLWRQRRSEYLHFLVFPSHIGILYIDWKLPIKEVFGKLISGTSHKNS